MSHKKVPPYGKYYFDLLNAKSSLPKIIHIICGQRAWELCNKYHANPPWLALPAYECPSGYLWPVAHAETVIYDTGYCEDDYLNDLAFCLYQSGAKLVRVVLPNFDSFTIEK